MDQGKVLDRTLLQELAGIVQVIGNVLHQTLLGALVQDMHPEVGDLAVVILGIAAAVAIDIASDGTAGGQSPGPGAFLGPVEGVGVIVGSTVLVVGDVHGAITLEVGHPNLVGTVHGDLQIVRSQAMAMGVGVGEEATLEHLIRRWLNSGHQMGRAKGDLFHLKINKL